MPAIRKLKANEEERFIMALLKKWRDMAYSETANKGDLRRFWDEYFQMEKEIYDQLLKNPNCSDPIMTFGQHRISLFVSEGDGIELLPLLHQMLFEETANQIPK